MRSGSHWVGHRAGRRYGSLLAALVLLASCSRDSASGRYRALRADLVISVELTGELEAERSTLIGPPALDRVWEYKISRLADEGTVVEATAPVLWFDTTQLQQQLLQARAERDSAQMSLEKRRTDLGVERERMILALAEAEGRERRSGLKADVPPALQAASELELARIDLELAEAEVAFRRQRIASLDRRTVSELRSLTAQLDRARAELTQLEQKIEAMTVHAPRGGTLLYRSDWRGQKKKVGDSVWQMETVLEIPELDSLIGRAEVDEAQSGRVAVGQRVRFRLDAHPDVEYRGAVDSIDQTVQRRSYQDPRRIVRLGISLDQIDAERMRPGMRLQGEVELDRITDAILVPLAAVVPDEGGAFVWLRRPAGKERVVPLLGRRNQELVEVLDGLKAGDVLLAP